MPIYEFICKSNGCTENQFTPPNNYKIIELLVKFNEEPNCSVCQKKLEKLISASKGYVKGTETPTRVI